MKPSPSALTDRRTEPHPAVPQVEVFTRAGGPESPPPPWYRARRLRVFLVVALGVLLPGLAWDFLRPAQYRATASVLTVATPMPGVGEPAVTPAAGTQHLAIQERVLLGQELMARTLERAGPAPAGAGLSTPESLREALEVTPLPDTSLVELAAVIQGPSRSQGNNGNAEVVSLSCAGQGAPRCSVGQASDKQGTRRPGLPVPC